MERVEARVLERKPLDGPSRECYALSMTGRVPFHVEPGAPLMERPVVFFKPRWEVIRAVT